MQRLDLGTVREIVGTFIGSAKTLADATRATVPMTDDRPLQEYAPRSGPQPGEAVPGTAVDLSQVGAWCPRCFIDGKPAPLAEGLDTYLGLVDLAYSASPAGKGRVDEAIAQFRQSLQLDPDSSATHWRLGDALASQGASQDALAHLRRSVELDPANAQAHADLASLYMDTRQLDAAVEQLRAALRLTPDSVDVHNSLGVALAMQGHLDEAIDHFQRALALNPDLPDTRRNLAIALQQRGQTARHRGP
jgi:tetratricopeptide (TPR) repeat protein